MERVSYAGAIGSLMFAVICNRPNIAQELDWLVDTTNSEKTHLETVKNIFKYLGGTSDNWLVFDGKGKDLNFVRFYDFDYVVDRDQRKSTSLYVFTLGGTSISCSALQTIVVLSTIEAELTAVVKAGKEALYLKQLICDLGFAYDGVVVSYDS